VDAVGTDQYLTRLHLGVFVSKEWQALVNTSIFNNQEVSQLAQLQRSHCHAT
jgi:hypothetical protein